MNSFRENPIANKVVKSLRKKQGQAFPRWDINKEGKFNLSEFNRSFVQILKDRYHIDEGAASGIARAALEVMEQQGIVTQSASSERFQEG